MTKIQNLKNAFRVWEIRTSDLFRISNLEFRTSAKAGFTLTEIAVMTSIIIFVSLTVLVNFGGLRDSAALSRSSRELALALRQAQSVALGVTVVGGQVPPYAGIKLFAVPSSNASRYLIFADLNGNKKYDDPPGPDIIIEEKVLEKGVRINKLRIRTTPEVALNPMHVLFSSPEAAVFLTDFNGTEPYGGYLEIELTSPAGLTKKVIVRGSGQISIK